MSVLQDIVGGSLTEGISKIISLFKVDPNKAAEQAFELEKIKLEMATKLNDAVTQEVQAAAATIQAEAKSEDKLTSRARPMFMYVVEAILAANLLLIPVLNWILYAVGVFVAVPFSAPKPFELPSDVLWLFGVCITGYVSWRSFDKFMNLPGQTSVKLPGGIHIANDPEKK